MGWGGVGGTRRARGKSPAPNNGLFFFCLYIRPLISFSFFSSLVSSPPPLCLVISPHASVALGDRM